MHAEDLDCVVEPGVTRKQLNDHLRDQGLFFPIDPGADASLGGMAATRASGTNAVRYGTMKDNVLSAHRRDGRRHGRSAPRGRAKKSSAGYDLTRLLVGSEGTLGIITELTLRLQGIPQAIVGRRLRLPERRGRLQRGHRHHPVRHPGGAHRAARRAAGARLQRLFQARPARDADAASSSSTAREAGVKEQAEEFGAIAAEFGGGDFRWATREEDRQKLWQARHDAYCAAAALRPGAEHLRHRCLRADLAPRRLRDGDEGRHRRASASWRPIVGHVGDGNFHVQPAHRHERRRRDGARREALHDRLAERAIAMDGTCTGEHGIGQGKIAYLEEEPARRSA